MLNERKLRILQAIIQDYIETAEPVGSRTLSKKYDLGVSPATIRNEMSDLEELGFIVQPHTSAGRIPSDKGYRLYVDRFMTLDTFGSPADCLVMDILNRTSEIDQILQYGSKLLSQLTNYTSVAVVPKVKESKLKHMQLVPIDENNMLAIIITDSGVVKKLVIRMDHTLNESGFQTMSNFLNDKLHGLEIKNIETTLFKILNDEIMTFRNIMDKIMLEVFKTLEGSSDIELFLNGTMNIFNFPEYNDIFKAKSFLGLLEEKEVLSNIITSSENEGVTVSIGSENVYEVARDFSLVTATYKLEDTTLGWLSVIGPTRMNYSNVVGTMSEISTFINDLLKNRYK